MGTELEIYQYPGDNEKTVSRRRSMRSQLEMHLKRTELDLAGAEEGHKIKMFGQTLQLKKQKKNRASRTAKRK